MGRNYGGRCFGVRVGEGARALRNKTQDTCQVHLSLSYICGGSHKSLWVLREGKRHGVVELSTSLLFFGYWPQRCCLRVRLLVYGLISRASISSMLPLRGMITFL